MSAIVPGVGSGGGGGGGGAVYPDNLNWTLTGTSANVNITNFPASFGATQSGVWSIGRTWVLSSGTDSVTVAGTVAVSNFPATQPVSGTVTSNQGGAPWTVKPDGTVWSLTGTAANVSIANASLPVTQSGAWSMSITGTATITGSVSVSNFPATQAISAAALPLPTGAATSALQSTINTTLGSPFQAGGSIGNTAFGATQSGVWSIGRTWTLASGTDSVNVGNFPASQTVTGSVTVSNTVAENVTQLNSIQIDVASLLTAAGLALSRQRNVIADNNNVNQYVDVDMYLQQRRANDEMVRHNRDLNIYASTVTRYCAAYPPQTIADATTADTARRIPCPLWKASPAGSSNSKVARTQPKSGSPSWKAWRWPRSNPKAWR